MGTALLQCFIPLADGNRCKFNPGHPAGRTTDHCHQTFATGVLFLLSAETQTGVSVLIHNCPQFPRIIDV
jgi:hypothetical protein